MKVQSTPSAKNIVKKLFQSFGLNVVRYNASNSEEVLLKTILKHFNVQTVIDVGANEGQYAAGLLTNGYSGTIYSFEPIQKPFEQLRRKAERTPKWKAFNYGVGSKTEDIAINVSENIVSSSIFSVEHASVNAEPSSKIVRQEKIRLVALETFFTDEKLQLSPETLLKLDVQGFEMEVLKGCQRMLPQIRLIQAELSFVPLYQNAPLFQEVVTFLAQKGFEIYSIIPGFRDLASGRMLQADGIFLNTNR
jgi:FkbM family methyltransferase